MQNSSLGMYISYCLCQFHLRLVANANPVSSGIWAQFLLLFDFISGEAVNDREHIHDLRFMAPQVAISGYTVINQYVLFL